MALNDGLVDFKAGHAAGSQVAVRASVIARAHQHELVELWNNAPNDCVEVCGARRYHIGNGLLTNRGYPRVYLWLTG